MTIYVYGWNHEEIGFLYNGIDSSTCMTIKNPKIGRIYAMKRDAGKGYGVWCLKSQYDMNHAMCMYKAKNLCNLHHHSGPVYLADKIRSSNGYFSLIPV